MLESFIEFGVTVHFSEILKQQQSKNGAKYVTPSFLFRFQQPLLRSVFSRRDKIVLEGTILKKAEFLLPSGNAQNVCAVTKGDTIIIKIVY